MQRVGASVTMLPPGEIFQALETGVIDATEYSQPVVDQALGFARIAKYNYFPGWHQPFSATHLVVNLDVWRALPASDRALLDGLCTGAVTLNLGLSETLQGPVVAGLAFDPVWFTVLFAVCLQTSFLTPPIGGALFYLRGIAPPGIDLRVIYRGVVPFIVIQLIALVIVYRWEALVTWLPVHAYGIR